MTDEIREPGQPGDGNSANAVREYHGAGKAEYTLAEASKVLGVDVKWLANAASRLNIGTTKMGALRVIPRAEMARLAHDQPWTKTQRKEEAPAPKAPKTAKAHGVMPEGYVWLRDVSNRIGCTLSALAQRIRKSGLGKQIKRGPAMGGPPIIPESLARDIEAGTAAQPKKRKFAAKAEPKPKKPAQKPDTTPKPASSGTLRELAAMQQPTHGWTTGIVPAGALATVIESLERHRAGISAALDALYTLRA